MKVYSWGNLLFAICMSAVWIVRFLGIWKGPPEDRFMNLFWVVMIAMLIARTLYYALSRDGCEEWKQACVKHKRVARELFGKWALAVEYGA